MMNAESLTNQPKPTLDFERQISNMQRRGLGLLVMTSVAFAIWGLCAPISGGVVTQGLVKVEANRRSVSHRDGGTVSRVLVREGQVVQKGDVLIELADVRVEASAEMVRAQLAADRLRASRLEAEASGSKSWAPPPDLMRKLNSEPRLMEQAAKERAAFAARRTALDGQITGEMAQAADTRKEIEIRLLERTNSEKAVALMAEELRVNEQLEQEQFVNRTRIMSLQRAVSEYQSRQAANEAELAQANQRLRSFNSRIRALQDGHTQQASEELREVFARITDNEQRLRANADEQLRQAVLAPESGRLVNLRVNTIGSAIGPREPIVDLVPSDAPLLIEARLSLDVAADVHSGMTAELKALTAQAKYEPLLPATVTQVAADAQQDERGGQPFVTAQLQVSNDALLTSKSRLQPGMAAEVYIKVSERTPFGFLMEPITGYFRRAFRDR